MNMTKSSKRTIPHGPNRRLTIGLLADRLDERYQSSVLDGVMEAAEERDVNLLCISGRELRSPITFVAQNNILYDLVSAENVDGLMVMGSLLFHFTGPEEIHHLYHERYRPLPVVSIALEVESIPSILVDNRSGIHDAVSHLIEAHGYRRIAFIRGPEGSSEAELRYKAYCDALAEHGLPLNPDLVAPGDFNVPSGREAVALLLDQRKVALEAIVAANDNMALGALEALEARGIDVPGTVALTGFDDVEAAFAATPPLTTVQQPLHTLGRRAVELLLARLAGEEVDEKIVLPTNLMVRQSCGCISQTLIEAGLTKTTRVKQPFAVAFSARRQQILSTMVQAVKPLPGSDIPGWMGQLLDSFVATLTAGKAEGFLSTLDGVLRQVVTAGGNVAEWHGVLSAIHREVLPLLSDKTRLQAESLCQQARTLLGETAQRVQINRRLEAEQRVLRLSEINQTLTTSANLEELVSVVAQQLPRLGIRSCYISLYDGAGTPPEWSKLILAYDERGKLETGGRRFPSRQLVPPDLLPQGRRYSLVVEALHFREHQLGIALFELGPRDRTIYEALRVQISSGLQGMLIQEERRRAQIALERRAVQLQAAAEVSRAASSILDPDELMQQAVNLIRDRFGLYYVGLFLLDQEKRNAVLRAGTGEAGQKMLAAGHKLAVGGTSMVSWCITNRQARIALDVGEEAVRFENPLLPNTRSELALPLISRGQVIGALTVQSNQPAAFSQEDVSVLQTMADQLAGAIENARLFEQTRLALEEVEATHRRYLSQQWQTYLAGAGKHLAGYLVGPEGLVEAERVWTVEMEQALSLGKPVVVRGAAEEEGVPRRSALAVPIRLYGQPVGVLDFYDENEERVWSEDERALVEALADQIALALENARLFEQTQRRAQREQLISQVTTRMRTAPDLESILQTSVREIRRALGASHGVIRLSMKEEPVRS